MSTMTRDQDAALERLHERIDELITKLTEVSTGFASLHAEHTSCQRRMARIDTVLDGNGMPGLVTRVTRLEADRPTNRHQVDTLSVKGILALTKGAGTFLAASAAAVASILQIVLSK